MSRTYDLFSSNSPSPFPSPPPSPTSLSPLPSPSPLPSSPPSLYRCLGVGGNLVAVQASRISTALHKAGSPGKLSSDSSERYHGPLRTFCSKSEFRVLV